MKLVILAAGMGSRYGGLKQLEPVTKHGEFIIDFSCFDAIRTGYDEIIFIIKRENLELFRESVGKRVEKHIKVSYAFQDVGMLPEGYKIPEGRVKPWGTGHALLCAKDNVGKDFFNVINADDFYGSDSFSKISEFFKGKDINSSECCMAGYILKNTLTENGSVSRGVCQCGQENILSSVTERTKIMRENGETVYYEDGNAVKIDENSYVSMNFWGFTPCFFEELENGFKHFLDTLTPENALKGEYYIPLAVTNTINKGKCSFKVIPVHSKWFGVTYHEDKPSVVNGIGKLIESGNYPDGLWD